MLLSLAMAALASGCASNPGTTALPGSPGCATASLPPVPSAAPATADAPLLARVWMCSDKRPVTLYPRGNAADIVVNGCQSSLTRVAADAGTLYENSTLAFWEKGTTASLLVRTGGVVSCHEIPLLSRIEDARVRGVNWRGHGLDGSWSIEVGPGPWLRFNRDGLQPDTFGRSARVINPNTGITLYTASNGHRTISVEVEPEKCRDQAGNTLPGAVSVSLDGKVHEGCGIPLSR